MGSITSKPKAPTVITVPAAPVVTTPIVTATESTNTQTDDEVRSEARESSLLRRSRGRLGTIATSFRGLLVNDNDTSTTQPKTLLGE